MGKSINKLKLEDLGFRCCEKDGEVIAIKNDFVLTFSIQNNIVCCDIDSPSEFTLRLKKETLSAIREVIDNFGRTKNYLTKERLIPDVVKMPSWKAHIYCMKQGYDIHQVREGCEIYTNKNGIVVGYTYNENGDSISYWVDFSKYDK